MRELPPNCWSITWYRNAVDWFTHTARTRWVAQETRRGQRARNVGEVAAGDARAPAAVGGLAKESVVSPKNGLATEPFSDNAQR